LVFPPFARYVRAFFTFHFASTLYVCCELNEKSELIVYSTETG
jgi:hypothetical protein